MEEGKPREARPYQRIYEGSDFKSELEKVPRKPRNILRALHNHPLIDEVNISVGSDFKISQTGSITTYVFDNPKFIIEVADQDPIIRTCPGYIRIDIENDNIERIEFSNAEIHELIFNPTAVTTSSLGQSQPKLFSTLAQKEALDETLKTTTKKNSGLKNLLQKMKNPDPENKELEKTRKRTGIQTYTSRSAEEKIGPFFCQEMASLVDILFPTKGSGKKIQKFINCITEDYKISLAEAQSGKLTLNIELSSLALMDNRSLQQYPLTGKLILEYDFNEKTGFAFKNAHSTNVALLTFFSSLVLAPNESEKPEKLLSAQHNTFRSQPAERITSEADLLQLLNKVAREEIQKKVFEPSHNFDISRNDFDTDRSRNLQVEASITDGVCNKIRGFYMQQLTSLIPRISAYPLVLQKPTLQKFYNEGGEIFLRIDYINPTYILNQPYSHDDPTRCQFPGKMSITYAFNEKTGFTLLDMSFSNNVLYNLSINMEKLFPLEDDPKISQERATQFNQTVRSLQDAARKQEEGPDLPKGDSNSPATPGKTH